MQNCTVGGFGRQIEVECGKAKGKDVIEVTFDESGNQTKFKVDIECV